MHQSLTRRLAETAGIVGRTDAGEGVAGAVDARRAVVIWRGHARVCVRKQQPRVNIRC